MRKAARLASLRCHPGGLFAIFPFRIYPCWTGTPPSDIWRLVNGVCLRDGRGRVSLADKNNRYRLPIQNIWPPKKSGGFVWPLKTVPKLSNDSQTSQATCQTKEIDRAHCSHSTREAKQNETNKKNQGSPIKTIKSHDSILVPLLGRGVFTAGFAPPRPSSTADIYTE